MKDKLTQLDILYNKIHSCHKCHSITNGHIKLDPKKVKRKIFNNTLETNIFIVAQSLASNQVRKSGIQFHDINQCLSKGGYFLEKFLNKIGHTLKPQNKTYKLVYTSDIVQCYPGRKSTGTGDNIPSSKEISNCLNYLLEEISLVSPKLLLIFGAPATKTFFKYFKNNQTVKSQKSLYAKEHHFCYEGIENSFFVLPHPTSMVPRKSEIFEESFKKIMIKLTE